jgi:hypothetical protein
LWGIFVCKEWCVCASTLDAPYGYGYYGYGYWKAAFRREKGMQFTPSLVSYKNEPRHVMAIPGGTLMNRFICAVVVVLFATICAAAETYSGKFISVKDGKITIRVLGKGDPDALQRTYPLAKKVEVRTGKFVRDDKTKMRTLEEGDLIKDGLKSDTFGEENVAKGFRVAVVLDSTSGKVTKVIVLQPNKKTPDQ